MVMRLCCAAIVGLFMVSTLRAGEIEEGTIDAAKAAAGRIDGHLVRRWEDAGAVPAPTADDAEFLRRAYLDIAGKLPPPAVVREFLASSDPDERRRAVEGLLASPDYVRHFASFWQNVLIPEAKTNRELLPLVPAFDLWMKGHLERNTPYDQWVEELLAIPLTAVRPYYNRQSGPVVPSAVPFFAAKEVSPENLAAATSRAFFGVRLECAQCHDHPFDQWKQKEFWAFAAFFGGIERQGMGLAGPVRDVFDRRELMIPDTQIVVQAAYLDRAEPEWRPREGARQTLARWATSPENAYFAKAVVNRLWGHFLGYGLVDPIDDFSSTNAASHPLLLDELAEAFIAQGFDLKFLIRAVTLSRAYQLSSRRTDASQDDPRLFARMALRRLSTYQVQQCLVQVTGKELSQDPLAEASGLAARVDPSAPRDHQVSILFALAAMNGTETLMATDPLTAPLLAATASKTQPMQQRVEALYLATLSRLPTDEERTRCLAYVEAGDIQNARESLSDVLWSLLNSSEFLVNH